MSRIDSLRVLGRRALTALPVAVLPLLLGGWIYGPQSTFDAKGPVARAQLDVFYTTVWVTMVIFVIVAGVLAYATWKFKARSSGDEHAEPPPQGHGNPLIELGLIGASVLALVVIAIPTLRALTYTFELPEEEKATAYEVTAIGYQWWFRFEYPNVNVPDAGKLLAANELVIPAGRAVKINLRTTDVIHSFWVPKLGGKTDMIPNRGNSIWLKADEPGYFWGQCAEFCGESHAIMRFRVIALSEKDFADWTARQVASARTVEPAAAATAKLASYTFTPTKRNAPGYSEAFDAAPLDNWVQKQFPEKNEDTALIAEGRQLFKSKSCITCHMVRGHDGAGTTAPDLTHVGSRTTIAAGLLENTPENLHRWLVDPNNVKPGNKMWMGIGVPGYPSMQGYLKFEKGQLVGRNIEINDTEARALVAYLHSLK